MNSITFDPNGSVDFPHIAAVEGLLGGIGRLVFSDGTVQFAEEDSFPDVVYSPRMAEEDLEIFCKANLDYYEQYFEQNFDAIDAGNELPPIRRFWEE